MTLLSILAGLILFFSFMGGVFQGAVKSFFSLIVLIIAIPAAGAYCTFFAGLLSFLPGRDWENFLGFFITLAIASIVLSFIFYFPQKITANVWREGPLFRLLGGFLNLLGAAVGLVILTLVISVYPVWDWLQQALVHSTVISWLVSTLNFVQSMLPEIMRQSAPVA